MQYLKRLQLKWTVPKSKIAPAHIHCRLEAELLAKERLKDSSAIGTPLTNSETVSDGETRQRMTSQGLYNLMPAPPTK